MGNCIGFSFSAASGALNLVFVLQSYEDASLNIAAGIFCAAMALFFLVRTAAHR